jgi:nitrogen-specific signal transduction histidine kinase
MIESESAKVRRTAVLERLMLALRDAREPHDILAIVARNLGFEFGRACAAYELRDEVFRPVAASEVTSVRDPIAASSLDFNELRNHAVTRVGARDLIPVSFDGQMRALFALESASTPLEPDDMKFLHAVAAHAALALTTAFSFEQLRRYAAEGAALTEAARTILGFTELEPLAEALCRLALRLVHADCACVYGRRAEPELLGLIGCASTAERGRLPEELPGDPDDALALLRKTLGDGPLVATPMTFPLAGGPNHGGLMVVTRRRGRFEKVEIRVMDALVTLAALAIRNVELYEQSTRANRALAESNAFKDDLMAMFAHDFKGPLTVISGYAELMLESANGETLAGARTIMAQVARLAKLAEDALALAATQSAGFSLRREREDLAEFVREAVRNLAEADRVEIEAPAPVAAPFDRARLRHVIDNLIGNALKYSSENVHVIVRRTGREAQVIVADRGIGIPEAERDQIFDRFGRGSNTSRRGIAGSGVGLYIARKIVEVHGGRLEVASREDEGTTFTLALPLK